MNQDYIKIETIHNLVKNTIDLALKFQNVLGNMGNSVLNLLINEYNVLVVDVNKTIGSLFNEKLTQIEKNRSEKLKQIKDTIAIKIQDEDEDKKIAAHNIDFLFTLQGNRSSSYLITINSHTDCIFEMFKLYHEDELLQQSAKRIGMVKLISEFEMINLNFDLIYNERLRELKIEVYDSISDSISKLNNSYLLFCTYLEQATSLSPNTELNYLFNAINEIHEDDNVFHQKEKVNLQT